MRVMDSDDGAEKRKSDGREPAKKDPVASIRLPVVPEGEYTRGGGGKGATAQREKEEVSIRRAIGWIWEMKKRKGLQEKSN